MKRCLLLVCVIIFTFYLTGCGSEIVYDDLESYYTQNYENMVNGVDELEGMDWKERVHYYGMNILEPAKPICLGVGVGSFMLGLVLYRTIEKEKHIRKMAVSLFMVTIPLLCALFVAFLAAIISMVE